MLPEGTHLTVPRVGASRVRNLVLPCSQPHSSHSAQSHISLPTHFPSSPYSLVILSPLACHHSPAALSIPLSFPHLPSPILTTFLSMTCALKRFPLTSPCKLALPCVKPGFLRTAEPHRTSQLSPCGTPGVAVPCLCDAWQGGAIATEQHIDELFSDWDQLNN